jgi:hypothetical protein
MRCGPACILFFAVLASCANPPDMVNDPPVANFYDFQASGAFTAEVNGYYRENGTNEGRLKYDQVGGSYYLFYLDPIDFGTQAYWSIQDTIDTTLLDAMYYNGDSTSATAPTDLWSLVLGGDPPPDVQRVAITGTLTEGQTLTGHYLYTDPDGDAENVAATTLQWYRFMDVTETDTAIGTAIPGATDPSYTLVLADANMFLRLQVIPVDTLGLAGSPVLSGAVGPVVPL